MPRLAIFSVDPGGSTGVAWGIVNLRADTVVDAMRERTHDGSTTITAGRIEKLKSWPFQQAVRYQVKTIMELYDQFLAEFLRESRHGDIDIEFVCEHFILTGGPARHKPGIEGIFPAFLVGALIQAHEDEVILQSAGVGMKWNTRQHLDRYAAWIRGREHERAAFAHMAARVHSSIR